MDYTPRQIEAFLFIAQRRHSRELAELIKLHAIAAQGTGKSIEDIIKRLEA